MMIKSYSLNLIRFLVSSYSFTHPPRAKRNSHNEPVLSDEGSEARTAKSEEGS